MKKIGPQCELVKDFSKIKIDALRINQRNCSLTVKVFCPVIVMNVEKRCPRVLVIGRKNGYRRDMFGLKFQGNSL